MFDIRIYWDSKGWRWEQIDWLISSFDSRFNFYSLPIHFLFTSYSLLIYFFLFTYQHSLSAISPHCSLTVVQFVQSPIWTTPAFQNYLSENQFLILSSIMLRHASVITILLNSTSNITVIYFFDVIFNIVLPSFRVKPSWTDPLPSARSNIARSTAWLDLFVSSDQLKVLFPCVLSRVSLCSPLLIFIILTWSLKSKRYNVSY